jgi:hypothetical protein
MITLQTSCGCNCTALPAISDWHLPSALILPRSIDEVDSRRLKFWLRAGASNCVLLGKVQKEKYPIVPSLSSVL